MKLNITEAIKDGFNDTFSRNGLRFAGAVYILALISTVINHTILSEIILISSTELYEPMALAMGGPILFWVFLAIANSLAGTWLCIGIIRSFVNSETSQVNLQHFKEDIPLTLLNMALGGLVYILMIIIGSFLLLVPGIFLAVSFIFWIIYVSEEGQNFIEALESSWATASGNRVRLFALSLTLLIIGLSGIIFEMSLSALGLSLLGIVISKGINSLAGVIMLASVINAHQQLTN